MKIKSTPVIWTLFFSVSLAILAWIAYFYVEPREILVDKSEANRIGLEIAKNQGVNNKISQIYWCNDDKYASLGIANFIWYSENDERKQTSFNDLLKYISQSQPLPNWLVNIDYPPWNSREEFLSSKHDMFKNQLSHFLQENIDKQTQYLIFKLEDRLPKMLDQIKSPFAKMHLYENFYHIAMQEDGVYALIDYFVFQGDGTLASDRYNNQGWGLLQVLDNMKGNSDNLLREFISSADLLLTRRIANGPAEEAKQLTNWRMRLNTYNEL